MAEIYTALSPFIYAEAKFYGQFSQTKGPFHMQPKFRALADGGSPAADALF